MDQVDPAGNRQVVVRRQVPRQRRYTRRLLLKRTYERAVEREDPDRGHIRHVRETHLICKLAHLVGRGPLVGVRHDADVFQTCFKQRLIRSRSTQTARRERVDVARLVRLVGHDAEYGARLGKLRIVGRSLAPVVHHEHRTGENLVGQTACTEEVGIVARLARRGVFGTVPVDPVGERIVGCTRDGVVAADVVDTGHRATAADIRVTDDGHQAVVVARVVGRTNTRLPELEGHLDDAVVRPKGRLAQTIGLFDGPVHAIETLLQEAHLVVVGPNRRQVAPATRGSAQERTPIGDRTKRDACAPGVEAPARVVGRLLHAPRGSDDTRRVREARGVEGVGGVFRRIDRTGGVGHGLEVLEARRRPFDRELEAIDEHHVGALRSGLARGRAVEDDGAITLDVVGGHGLCDARALGRTVGEDRVDDVRFFTSDHERAFAHFEFVELHRVGRVDDGCRVGDVGRGRTVTDALFGGDDVGVSVVLAGLDGRLGEHIDRACGDDLNAAHGSPVDLGGRGFVVGVGLHAEVVGLVVGQSADRVEVLHATVGAERGDAGGLTGDAIDDAGDAVGDIIGGDEPAGLVESIFELEDVVALEDIVFLVIGGEGVGRDVAFEVVVGLRRVGPGEDDLLVEGLGDDGGCGRR